EFHSVLHINELSPYTMLLSAVGACTSIVLHTYAQNHGVALDEVELHLQYQRDFQNDQEDANPTGSFEEKIEERLMLRGDLNDQDRQKLFRVAQQCSIHKMLEAGIEINSQLVDKGDEK
ncbi:MAG TPA: OsmC family protein, partial [Anaerolineaceae bacterium]|nr:OsmC family protein [Anaerolineaceae bacterium]